VAGEAGVVLAVQLPPRDRRSAVSSDVLASASRRVLVVSRRASRARSSAAWVRGTGWGRSMPLVTRVNVPPARAVRWPSAG
jgi:hypothetical protein